MRAYAMSIVVFIHVASVLAPHYNTIAPIDWWISNLYHAFSKGGPPIFTLVSGMLLLNMTREQPLGEFFRKRFLKVLVPFLGWAVVYLAWRILFNGETMDSTQMINAVLKGPVYYHLWFIQMILGLYLATPVLRVYVRNASRANLRYFLIVWFLTITFLPAVSRMLNVQFGIDFAVMTNYVGYFVMGYYLRDVTLKPKQMLPALLVVVGTLLATEYAVHAMTMAQDGRLDTFFLNNLGFNMVIVSVAMFLFLKSLPWETIFERFAVIRWSVRLLASCSLGVYFVHVLIMELLGSGRLGFKISAMTLSPLVGIPLTAGITLVLSVIVILIMKRIPVLKTFVPG
ncbi:MAG: acyltransferase family protein [Chloroflexi bacterium]|nr:acyltransferase family protein [Chloroflexota bacterium]